MEELDSSNNKRTKLDDLLDKIKDIIECPVCLDIPHSSIVPVCFVCEKCKKTEFCPSCKTKMGQGKSLLAATNVASLIVTSSSHSKILHSMKLFAPIE